MTDSDLERFVARSPQAMAMFDREMRYVAASPRWMSDYRLTPAIVGRSHYDVFPEIGDGWKAVHRRCLAGATESSDGEPFERLDGGEQWIRWEVRPWRDRVGAVGGVIIATETIDGPVAEAQPSSEEHGEREGLGAPLSRGTASGMGARIWSVRLHLAKTQQAFAALLGVDPGAVQAWEAGRKIDRKALDLIAGVTGAPIEWLIAGLSPARVEAIRAAAPGERAPDPGARDIVSGEDCIRPRIAASDRDVAKSVAPAWRFRTARPLNDGPDVSSASPDRSRSTFLHLPGVTVWSGARARAYRLRKGGSSAGEAEVSLSVVLRGFRRFEALGRACEGGAGSATFALSTGGGRADFDPDGRYLTVFLPIEPALSRVSQAEERLLQPVAPDDPALGLLTAYAAALMKTEAGVDRELAPCVADHFVDLCAILLGAEGDERVQAEERGVRAAQTAAVREAIDAGAASPGFSILTVADRLGLTPREVHDRLEESGVWFSECVDARRVEIVSSRLADPKFGRMTVREVALACGVTDFERFDRLFRARFGEWPASARRRGAN